MPDMRSEKLKELSKKATYVLNAIGEDALVDIIKDTSELYDLLHLTEDEEKAFAHENFNGDIHEARNVRVIRTVYVLSKMIDKNYKTFKKIYCKYGGLWKEMEQ